MKKKNPNNKNTFLTVITLIAFFSSIIIGVLLGVIYDKILIGSLMGIAVGFIFLRYLPLLPWFK